MKSHRSILTLVLWIITSLVATAQDVIVSVTPVQQVLPPQVLLYVDNPGKYFQVSLINTTDEEQFIYLGMQIEQTYPSTGLAISTPPKRQPQKPTRLAPKQTLNLTSLEIKNLFKHIPSSEISCPAGLFDDYQNGSFALLPEGQYEAHLTAYRWRNPQYATPLVVSSPTGGVAYFEVCYKAQAPTFLIPNAMMAEVETPMINPIAALFQWTEPTLTCAPSAQNYHYDFRVVELLPGQLPTDAMDHNPTVYLSKNLATPQVLIPALYIQRDFKEGRTYLAQVTAKAVTSTPLSFVMLENEGKSPYIPFQIAPTSDPAGLGGGANPGITPGGNSKPGTGNGTGNEDEGENGGDDDDENESENEKGTGGGGLDPDPGVGIDIDNILDKIPNVDVPIDLDFSISDIIDVGDEIDLDDIIAIMGGVSGSAELVDAPPYRFRNPKIDKPIFVNENVHRQYVETDIEAEWTRPWFLGGEGPNPDEIRFEYNVQLFNGGGVVSTELALASKPIFEKKTNEQKLTIKWADISTKVQVGDEVYLRIVPLPSVDAKDIKFEEEGNILGLTICKPVVRDIFECSTLVAIDNRKPTTLSPTELRGRKVKMGEFDMEMGNDIQSDGRKAGTVTGHAVIKWMPGGFATNVHVRVDTLSLNTELVVIGGVAHTYGKDQKTVQQSEGVDKLFSDWGLDNLTGAGGSYSYAKTTQLDANDPENAINVNIDVEGYFNAFHNMSAAEKKAASLLGKANMNDFYCPARLPDYLNEGPLDMQIASMTFTPYYATMNIVGELQIEEKANRNNILMFGAPRLCFGPSNLIPEAGTIALLADYGNIRDPKTGYVCRFKAPKNLDEPTDGCYMAWKDYTFRELGIDVDMKLPNLKKVEGGKVTSKKPILNIKTTINSWESWVASATLDPFEIDGLPGWTFEAQDIVLDHSKTYNHDSMVSFPQGYDKAAAGLQGQNPEYWQGLFIKTVGVSMPKSLQVGSGRLKLSFNNMFVDCSGLTMQGGITNAFKVKTGSLGGWAFNLEEVGLSFIQSNFNNCYFSGDVQLPLLTDDSGKKAKLDYRCEIRRRLVAGKQSDGTAFLFTVQAADEQNLNLDLFLATVQLKKATTYLAVEATEGSADASANKTYVEFCMGGVIEIAGKKNVERSAKKLSLDLSLPDVHFTGFRIANCSDKEWTSSYAEINRLREARQAVHLNESASYVYYGGDTKSTSDGSFWFSTGQWSLASLEKELGPFKFKLDKYGMDISLQNNAKKGSYAQVTLKLSGSVTFIDGFSLTAGASVDIKAGIYNISSFSDITTDFEDIVLTKCEVDCSVDGMRFFGSVSQGTDATWGKGFSAALEVSLPGDLFTFKTSGGFYKQGAGWNWGYLTLTAETAVGVPVPPIQFDGFSGGFYFNCSSKASNPNSITPNKGVIGVMLGVSISAMGSKDLINGHLQMTVAYDTKRGGFSQFLFTGNVDAVNGLVSSKVTLLYENTEMDKYFQLNICLDVSAANAAGAGALNSEMESYATKNDVSQNFKNIEDEEKKGGGKSNGGEVQPTASQPKLGELHLELDFKVTFKENGKNLANRKWHLYLGEPDYGKRVRLTLIDLNAYIVQLTMGANMYVCIGNELPGDGALPPIPQKIADCLDGSTKGAGVQSDNISQANAARAAAAGNFGGSISGGVMFGAQIYGKLTMNLGIVYGKMEMLAGFDVSLRKLSGSAYCMNLGKAPGWHQWYGEGQLYAYMAADLGLGVDLGFFEAKIPLIQAEMGGVLQMGGPAPSYFIGKVRAKVNLFSGLVKFNKKFEFECGQVCQLFRGNPLDDFVLFDKCTIGDTLRSEGWLDKNRIAPVITQSPRISVNASLNEHFRVLDENELEKIRTGFNPNGVERELLEMQAERTFIFLHYTDSITPATTVKLRRYKVSAGGSPIDDYDRVWNIPVLNDRGEFLAIDIKALNSHLEANKFYSLEVSGRAYEIQKGVRGDPVYFDTDHNTYTTKPWVQTSKYYFATNGNDDIEDQADLQKYVALAYPSRLNELMDGVKDDEVSSYRNTYYTDATGPTIAMTRDIHEQAFKKGRVQWRVSSPSGTQIYATDAAWVVDTISCSLEPKNKLKGIVEGGDYILSLDYLMLGKDNVVDTISISRQHIHVLSKSFTWMTGYGNKGSLDYEKPFVATKLTRYVLSNPDHVDDYKIASGFTWNGVYILNLDPSYYISYLANWAFIGGHKVKSNHLLRGLYVTTTESAILDVPGVGRYAGNFNGAFKYQISGNKGAIRELLFYLSDPKLYGNTPLPTLKDPTYDYAGITDPGIMPLYPSNKVEERAKNVLDLVKSYYWQVEDLQADLKDVAHDLDRKYSLSGDELTSNAEKQKEFLRMHQGTYIGEGIVKVPFYQIAIAAAPLKVSGGLSLNGIFEDDLSERGYRECQLYAMLNLVKNGQTMSDYKKIFPAAQTGSMFNDNFDGNNSYSAAKALKLVTQMAFQSYRVNAFDYKNGRFITRNLMNGTHTCSYSIKNPYNNPQVEWSNTSGSTYEISSGSTVGGESYTMDGNDAEKKKWLEQMKSDVRALLVNKDKVIEFYKTCKNAYDIVKSTYDTDIARMVKCYNNKEFPVFESTSGLRNRVNIIRDHTFKEKDTEAGYRQLNSAGIFSNLQDLNKKIAKGAAANSALKLDAQSELNRGQLLNEETIEYYEKIVDMYNKADAMVNEYFHSHGRCTLDYYNQAYQLYLKANSDKTLIEGRLKKDGDFDASSQAVYDKMEKIKSLIEEEHRSNGAPTYTDEYTSKKSIDAEVQTKATEALAKNKDAYSYIDYLKRHKTDMDDYMTQMLDLGPLGCTWQKKMSTLQTTVAALYDDREKYLDGYNVSDYDIKDLAQQSTDYMDVLKMHAEAEAYFFKLEELDQEVEALYTRSMDVSVKYGEKYELKEALSSMDKLLGNCFTYVAGDPSDGKTFKNLTTTTKQYKDYMAVAKPWIDWYAKNKSSSDSLSAIYNRASDKNKEAQIAYNTYCDMEKDGSFQSKAKSLLKNIGYNLRYIDDLVDWDEKEWADIRWMTDVNENINFLGLYKTPGSINEAAKSLSQRRWKVEGMLVEAKDIFAKGSKENAPIKAITDPYVKFGKKFGLWYLDIFVSYLALAQEDNIFKKGYDAGMVDASTLITPYHKFTYEFDDGRSAPRTITGNIFEMYFDYLLPLREVTMEELAQLNNKDVTYVGLDALHEESQRLCLSNKEINVPKSAPDYVAMRAASHSIELLKMDADILINETDNINTVTDESLQSLAAVARLEVNNIKKKIDDLFDAFSSASDYGTLVMQRQSVLPYMQKLAEEFKITDENASGKLSQMQSFLDSDAEFEASRAAFKKVCGSKDFPKAIEDFNRINDIITTYKLDEVEYFKNGDGSVVDVEFVEFYQRMQKINDISQFDQRYEEVYNIVKAKVESVMKDINDKTRPYSIVINSVNYNLSSVRKNAVSANIKQSVYAQFKTDCEQDVMNKLVNCINYTMNGPDGTFRSRDIDIPTYSEFVNSVSAVATKYASFGKQIETLNTICAKFPEYKQSLQENLENYCSEQIFQESIKDQQEKVDACYRLMDEMEQYLRESQTRYALAGQLAENVKKLGARYNISGINGVGSKIISLFNTLTTDLAKAQQLVAKMPKASATRGGWIEGVEELVKAFDNQMDDIEAGYVDIDAKFRVVENEGEQGFEEEYFTDVCELVRDHIDPVVTQAAKNVGTSSSSTDFASLKKLYDKDISLYKSIDSSLPEQIDHLVECTQMLEQLKVLYAEAERYYEPSNYVKDNLAHCEVRLTNFIRRQGSSLAKSLEGFDEVYVKALAYDNVLTEFAAQYEKFDKLVDDIIENHDGIMDKQTAKELDAFVKSYKYSNVPTELSKAFQPYVEAGRELQKLYDYLYDYDFEPYLEEVADDKLTQIKKRDAVFALASALKNKMSIFNTKITKDLRVE